MDDNRSALRAILAAIAWHRRLLAAGLAAAAAALAIQVAAPSAPDAVPVVVAAHDLEGGSALDVGDLATARLPPDALPAGLLDHHEAVGGVLAGPVRAGEPITDRRLLGPDLLAGWGPELVATPVRLADAGAAAYLRHGDRIDLLAAPADGAGAAAVVADDARVLAVQPQDDGALTGGALILVAATPGEAADLAAAAVSAQLSFTLGDSGSGRREKHRQRAASLWPQRPRSSVRGQPCSRASRTFSAEEMSSTSPSRSSSARRSRWWSTRWSTASSIR